MMVLKVCGFPVDGRACRTQTNNTLAEPHIKYYLDIKNRKKRFRWTEKSLAGPVIIQT